MEFIYKVVTLENGRLKAELYDNVKDLKKKHKQIGVQTAKFLREELQGQPRLDGLFGGMWDGYHEGKPCIRYESPEAYDMLSR